MHLLCLDVVTEEGVLIADVELAIGDHGMRPRGQARAFGLFEAPALQIFFAARFDQNHGALLGAVIDPTIRKCDRAFANPPLIGVALVPQNLARFEVEAD